MSDLRTHFEILAERWDGMQTPDRGERLRRMLEPVAPLCAATQSILEVGTGTGALIPCLQECAPSARLVSIDLAAEMLRRAQQRCPDAAVVQADAQRPPFSPSGFDLIVCHNSFPHFSDKPAALLSLARALVPGGYLLILHDLSREKVNTIHSSSAKAIQNDLLPPGAETAQMLTEAGFSVLTVKDTDDGYRVVARLNWKPRCSPTIRATH